MRTHPSLRKTFHVGDSMTIDGVKVTRIDGDFQPGDLYVAQRNTGPHLLTVNYIDPSGWIAPVEWNQYCYDLHECVRVIIS